MQYFNFDLDNLREVLIYLNNVFQITNGVFFGVGAIFMFFDLTGKPAFLRKYKVQVSKISNKTLVK